MLLSCLKMILLGGLKIGFCAAFEPFKLKNSSNFTKMHAFWGMNAYYWKTKEIYNFWGWVFGIRPTYCHKFFIKRNLVSVLPPTSLLTWRHKIIWFFKASLSILHNVFARYLALINLTVLWTLWLCMNNTWITFYCNKMFNFPSSYN